MSAPDLTTEVIGFRQWYVTPDLTLRAAHMKSATWTPGVNEAKCRKGTTVIAADPAERPCAEAPGHDCECGMYALHSPDDFWYGKGGRKSKGVVNPYTLFMGDESTDVLVSGVVVAWGNIEVHHSGFRSQYARIVALAAPAGKRDAAVARAVAAEYGVPLVAAQELPGIAGEFGQAIPESLRPDKPAPSIVRGGVVSGITIHQFGSTPYGYPQPSWQPSGAVYTHGYATGGNVGNPFYYTDATVSFDTGSLLTSNVPWLDAARIAKEAQKPEAKPPQRKPTARGTGYDPRHFQSKRHGGLA